MCIVYEVEGSLYINLTNKCSNKCVFCIRNNGDGAYGSDSLWLSREPSVSEVLEAVASCDIEKYREIVFCGYGEPSYRLLEAREIALKIKEEYPQAKIRMNTNGQSDLILAMDTAPLYEGAFDSVSISLNASNEERYQKICHSEFGAGAFLSIVDFAKRLRSFVPRVSFSVVKETLSAKELSECYEISEKTGVALRVRD